MLNFYVKYNFNDDVSLKYTYSDNEVHQYVIRDGDYTNRQGGRNLLFPLMAASHTQTGSMIYPMTT